MWRTRLSSEAVERSYGWAMAVGAFAILAAAFVVQRRRVPDWRPWTAYGVGLGAAMAAGAYDTLAAPVETHPGYLVVLGLGVPLVAGAVPRLIRLRHAGLDSLLDSLLVATAGTFWAWELRFQPTPDTPLDTGLLIPLAFVALCTGMATLALLTGDNGHISRIRWLMAAGFASQALAIVVLPETMAGREYADHALGTSLMIAGIVPLIAANFVAAGLARTEVPKVPKGLRWWAPVGIAAVSYAMHAVVRESLPGLPGDRVEQLLIGVAAVALMARVVRVVGSERRMSSRLDSQRRRLETLLSDSQDHIVIVDEDFVVLEGVNRDGDTATGMVGMPLLEALHPDDVGLLVEGRAKAAASPGVSQRQELRLVVGGHVSWIEGSIVDHTANPLVGGLVVTFRDITERRVAQEDLRRQANEDELTGLPNRNAIRAIAEAALASASEAQPVSLLYCDLDRLKVINDGLGHDVGDQVIAAVAARWDELIGPWGTIGRVGGDEFVVVVPHNALGPGSQHVGTALIDDLNEPVHVGDRVLSLSVSVGLSVVTSPETTVDAALRDADAALYAAKNDGRNRLKVFDPAMRANALLRLQLEQELRDALREGGIEIHLQPIVDLDTGLPVSFEALVRWNLEGVGWIPADRLIALAEESGLIVPLGECVLDLACAAIARIRCESGQQVRVAVNTSAIQLLHPPFVSTVLDTLAAHDLGTDALALEVTESVLIDEAGVGRATLTTLHGHGIAISMDDFGTGYSSLSYLGTFPLDELKLDRSLVTGAMATATGAAVLGGILHITESLGLPVVAEGLETEAAVDHLRTTGAQLGQGWFFAKPMTCDEAIDWIVSRAPLSRGTAVRSLRAVPRDEAGLG